MNVSFFALSIFPKFVIKYFLCNHFFCLFYWCVVFRKKMELVLRLYLYWDINCKE